MRRRHVRKTHVAPCPDGSFGYVLTRGGEPGARKLSSVRRLVGPRPSPYRIQSIRIETTLSAANAACPLVDWSKIFTSVKLGDMLGNGAPVDVVAR